MLKLSFSILTVILICLVFNLFYGPASFDAISALEDEVKLKQNEVNELIFLNEQSLAQIENLKTGYDAIEEIVRLEFGMIKKGEVFFIEASNENIVK